MSHDPLPSAGPTTPPGTRRPFRVEMQPHRSLSNPGFIVLMAAISVVSFVTGIVFAMLGAWPVLGFFGLDVLLIYWAFKVSYRSGRERETIVIDDGRLTLSHRDEDGRETLTELNAAWVDVRLERRGDGRNMLALASHGKVHPVGTFLSDDERAEVASVLWSALIEARGGPRI